MSSSEGAPGDKQAHQIDWGRVVWPSDSLTLRQLRSQVGHDSTKLDAVLHNLFLLERELVVMSVMTNSERPSHIARHVTNVLADEGSKALVTLYVQVGLATGPHEAAQLVDNLRASAIAATQQSVSRNSK